MKEALYYGKFKKPDSVADNRQESPAEAETPQKEDKVVCLLCPHGCVIPPGRVGLCKARQNRDGKLFSLNYSRVSSVHLDPIEKKPLYHFYPGTSILSLGTLGCNLSCSFCQNWSISQINGKSAESCFARTTHKLTPYEVGELAEKFKHKNSIGIAYTYNEPSVWFEFVLESCREVKKRGFFNVLVTNGYLQEAPQSELMTYVDAVNVDIKSIRDGFYKKLCRGRVQPVLEYCKRAKEKWLVEITNLLITGENDSQEDIADLVDWVAKNLGRDTPVHFSRYHPDYNFDAPATPGESLALAYKLGIEKLDYVYVGNVWESPWENTRCPSCHEVVIERKGYFLGEIRLRDSNRCGFCGAKVNVVRG